MPEETLRIMCPKLTCKKVLAVPASARGKTVRCRNCGTSIRIPEKEEKPVQRAPEASSPEENAA